MNYRNPLDRTTGTRSRTRVCFVGYSCGHSGVGGKSVRQADVSGGTHFPRKFCPTGQDILSASRIICPGLGGKSVRQENVSGPDPIISLA